MGFIDVAGWKIWYDYCRREFLVQRWKTHQTLFYRLFPSVILYYVRLGHNIDLWRLVGLTKCFTRSGLVSQLHANQITFLWSCPHSPFASTFLVMFQLFYLYTLCSYSAESICGKSFSSWRVFFFLIFLLDQDPFCGGTGTLCFGLRVTPHGF